MGHHWLKIHVLERWLDKMISDGPPPAPSDEMIDLFAERHGEALKRMRDIINSYKEEVA